MARPAVTEERRAQILDGLFEAMAAAGSDAASVSEIAQRSGLPRGALHYYFKNKDEMRRALMRRLGDRYVAGLQRALLADDGTPHPHALRRLLRFHVLGDPHESMRLLSVWIDFWGQVPADPELAHVVADVQARARAAFAEALVAAGCPVRGEALDARATVALAMAEGMVLQWRVRLAAGQEFNRQVVADAAAHAAHALAREVV